MTELEQAAAALIKLRKDEVCHKIVVRIQEWNEAWTRLEVAVATAAVKRQMEEAQCKSV
jgi:phage gp46-like protein